MTAGGTLTVEKQAMRSLERLPPFSPVLNRLLATLAKEDVSFAKLAALIEKDTVLAGNVLRVVNSALYGLQGTVNSVPHAIAVLGLAKLRNVVLGLSVSRMWRNIKTPAGWSGVSFNLHSVAAAILSDLLVQRLPAPYPEGAFVAGLLHDFGKLLIAVSYPEEFGAILERYEKSGLPLEQCESETLGTTHAALSGAALARWNLPAPIQRAVSFHHAPDEAGGGRFALAHIVNAADLLAIELGFQAIAVNPPRPPAPGILETLGIAADGPRLIEQFQAEFETLRKFF